MDGVHETYVECKNLRKNSTSIKKTY